MTDSPAFGSYVLGVTEDAQTQQRDAVLAEATRLDAIAARMAADPGNFYTYAIINDPELHQQAEAALGRPLFPRTNAKAADDPTRVISAPREWGEAIHDLRAKANDLRGSVRPAKAYPWLSCTWCDRITGWLDYNHCDQCEQASTVRSNSYKLPEAWIGPADAFDHILAEGVKPTRFLEPQVKTKTPWKLRAAALIGFRRKLRVWKTLAFAEPFERCSARPLAPEKDYVVWLPVKGEKTATNGSEQLILFRISSYRWTGSHWQTVDLRAPRIDFPTEFAATLPMEALTDAWSDFVVEIDRLNERFYLELHDSAAAAGDDRLEQTLRQSAQLAEVARGQGVLDALEQGSRG